MLLNYFFLNFLTNPSRVYLNIEKSSDKIIHTGVTFRNYFREIRFDYRAFNDNNNYITTAKSRKNISEMFPNLNIKVITSKGLGNELKLIYKKELFWGTSNYSINDIKKLEKKLHKRYILGFYDCRHYTDQLCKLTINKGIPIWDLKSLL